MQVELGVVGLEEGVEERIDAAGSDGVGDGDSVADWIMEMVLLSQKNIKVVGRYMLLDGLI